MSQGRALLRLDGGGYDLDNLSFTNLRIFCSNVGA